MAHYSEAKEAKGKFILNNVQTNNTLLNSTGVNDVSPQGKILYYTKLDYTKLSNEHSK